VRGVIQAILEREGYNVKPLADPRVAVELIRRAPPSLIITNVFLPGMTGHEAMRLFKETCPAMPVLMVSGLPDSEVIQRWMSEDGFDAFPKPFSAEQLTAKVKQVLAEAAR